MSGTHGPALAKQDEAKHTPLQILTLPAIL